MDPKVIEMNNLRVLHDYLNQTLDVLVRGQRFGASHTPGLGYSPFTAPIAGAPGAIGTDVYGPFGATPYFNGISPFQATNPFSGHPLSAGYGPTGYGPTSYGPTGYSPFGSWSAQPWTQSPWAPQTPWTAGQASWPVAEAARQAQVTQTLAAKQSVLEQMCRMAGIQF